LRFHADQDVENTSVSLYSNGFGCLLNKFIFKSYTPLPWRFSLHLGNALPQRCASESYEFIVHRRIYLDYWHWASSYTERDQAPSGKQLFLQLVGAS